MARSKRPAALDIDDMINDPSQRGMLSFLDVTAEQKRKMLEARDALATAEPANDSPAPVRSGSESGRPDSVGTESASNQPGAALAIAIDSRGTETTPRDWEAWNSVALKFGPRPTTRRRPFRVDRVQDCHTPAENRVFELMLGLARDAKERFGRIEPGGAALCWASQPELARRVRMHENNVRTILRSLSAKLSIELAAEADRSEGKGRTWRILPAEAIMDRRRRANLVWAIKTGGGQVRFVAPDEIARLFAEHMELESIGMDS